MIIKNNIIIAVIFVLSLFLVPQADAFSISPLKYTISLNPSDDKDLVVNVINDTNQNAEYLAVVVGIQQDNQGRPVFKTDSDIAESWVKFQNEKQLLKSKENKDFVFTITVPKNTPPGAHYLGLGVREISEKNIGAQLVTVVSLQVAGTANESLVLENFTPIKNYFFEKKLDYFLQIKNVGNVDLLAKAKIQILDNKNNIVDQQPVNLGNKIFPQAIRAAEFHQPISKKIIWPGLYHSMMIINYGLTNQQVVGMMNFWYCPIWSIYMVAGLVAVIIIIILLLFFRRKKT